MAASSSAPAAPSSAPAALRKRGLGRGPKNVPKAPTNPNERILIHVRPPPENTDFVDPKIVKCISQLCLDGWPTPVITWAETPSGHYDSVWEEFQVSFTCRPGNRAAHTLAAHANISCMVHRIYTVDPLFHSF